MNHYLEIIVYSALGGIFCGVCRFLFNKYILKDLS